MPVRSCPEAVRKIPGGGRLPAACFLHADALDDHGGIDEDSVALGAAIDFLNGGDTEHEAAKDQKKGFTKPRNLAADGLYKMCSPLIALASPAYELYGWRSFTTVAGLSGILLAGL